MCMQVVNFVPKPGIFNLQDTKTALALAPKPFLQKNAGEVPQQQPAGEHTAQGQ